MTGLTEKTLRTERKYTGRIVSIDLLDIELPDGRKAKREVIRHGLNEVSSRRVFSVRRVLFARCNNVDASWKQI